MKILKLKFKNINSLAGENEIDFTNPVFTREGLFAITGKTGAGKTSILDAISLAFYGETARLGVITVGGNDILTRGEKDCYAEVTFEAAGKQWKSSWKQAVNKNGNLNPVQRQIADDSDKIIADSIRGCDAKIVEILGLTFKQFTKVVMLAQGSFAAFLNADKNEKGALLEQITGTEIYGEISKKVFERNKQEKDKLERITIELKAITFLTDDQIHQLKAEIAAHEIERQQANDQLKHLETAQRWLTEVADLEKRLEEARKNLPTLQAQVATAQETYGHNETELNRITEERRKLEPVFRQVRVLDTKIAEKTNLLTQIRAEIPDLQKAIERAGKTLAEKKAALENFQASLNEKQQWANDNARYQKLVTDFSAIEERHQYIQMEKTREAQLAAKLDALYAQWTLKRTDLESADNALAEAQEKINTLSNDLNNKRAQLAKILDGQEITHLHAEKERLKSLHLQINRLMEIENAISGNNDRIKKFQERIHQCEQNMVEFTRQRGLEINAKSDLEKHIALLEENIRLSQTIQSLEELREHLIDGEVCPLCGSVHHPFASGNIPEASEKEKELNTLKDQLKQVLDRIQHADIKLAQSESDMKNAGENNKLEEKSLSENLNTRTKITTELQALDADITIPETENKIGTINNILKLHTEKIAGWDDLIEAASQINNAIRDLQETQIPAAQQALRAAEKLKDDTATAIKLIEQDMKTRTSQGSDSKLLFNMQLRTFTGTLKLYDVKDIHELKNCLDAWTNNAAQIAECTNQINSLTLETSTKEVEFSNLKNSLGDKESAGKNLDKDLQQLNSERKAIFSGDSVDEEETRWRNLQDKATTERDTASAALNRTKTELESQKAVIQTQEKVLGDTVQLQVTEKTLDEIKGEVGAASDLIQHISQQIGAKTQDLKHNEEKLSRNSQKIKEKERQQAIFNKWASLNDLIGSKDGKRYRNFAQALTFEHLIGLSNKQLQKMSDRYMLRRTDDLEDPFEMMVIDKFQNGEARTANNLSGGEKFIVSLSLALGLANMASKNMQIDTMFIDEGFGTLDSEYLDVALNALSNLQSEGKIIGVISHLSELKERIATHIEVTPGGNGFSKIRIMS